jgi:hypothetical protein
MKKTILTLLMAFFAFTTFAQNKEMTIHVPSGYQGFLEYGNSWHFNKAMSTGINLSTTHGFYYNGHVFVGVGVGIDFDENLFMLPFYTNVRYLFINDKFISPFMSLRLGSFISNNIGAYGDFGVGVRFASKRDFAVNVMVVGSYFSKVNYGHDVSEVDEFGYPYTQYVTERISPSHISLRLGIEW